MTSLPGSVDSTICLSCRHDNSPRQDNHPFCSSCCEAGWDCAYGRGVRDAVLALILELNKRKDAAPLLAILRAQLSAEQWSELEREL